MNLILIPGLLCDPDLWAHQREHLAALADIRVADITGGETMDELAEQVLASAPDRFALAGLSMGGYVAHAIMRMAPERVERLALLDTSGRPDTDEQRERRTQLIEMSRIGKFRGVTDRLLPILVHEDRLGDTALTDRVKAMAERIGPEAFHRQQKAIMSRPDSRPQFASYDLPVLVICGRQDALTPVPLHEEMAEAIAGAQLAIIEDSGHLSTMEQPQAATALLRQWLLYG
ncbi:MAG: alpha/beta fold hydrolase [Alphaproteobacteria bacterium]|nr:alpha/beta fold hydrolase [Alphaproteobacteria bacterium]